jgi:lysophospholipase L1-like esterase
MTQYNVGDTGHVNVHNQIALDLPNKINGADVPAAVATTLADPTSAAATGLNATIGQVAVPRWKATTTYALGDKVVSPSGDVVSAIAAFTSGASYDATKWALSATIASKANTADVYTKIAADVRFAEAGDWLTAWDRCQNEPLMPNDAAVLAWAATMTTSLTTPVVYKPEKVGIGSATSGWDGKSDPIFRYFSGTFRTSNGGASDLALYGETKPGGAAQAAAWPLVFEFSTTAAAVEIAGYSTRADHACLIEVNGRFVSDTLLQQPAEQVGNGFKLNLTFPGEASVARRIRVWTSGGFGLSEVRVPTGKAIAKPTEPIQRCTAIIGDSFVNGAGQSNVPVNQGAGNFETFAPRLARLMAADDIILAGIGGTGWVAGGATNAFYTRIAAVLAMNPQVIVFYGSINDGTAGTGVQAAVESALQLCAAVPKIYVIGPLTTGYSAANDAVKAGTLAKGRTFIDMGAFLFGNGNVTDKRGDGNRDFYMMTDGAHPTFAAHKAIARRAFALVAKTWS